MKALLLALISLFYISCTNPTEPKDINVSLTEVTNNPIYCKRLWYNGGNFSYAIYSGTTISQVDSIKLSKGFGSFVVELYRDSTWTMKTFTEVRYIKL